MLNSTSLQSVLLYDNDDVNFCTNIKGNLSRKESLDVLCKKYCFEVLIVLFETLTQLHDFKTCNAFMTHVKERQPKVVQCLKPDEIQILLRR